MDPSPFIEKDLDHDAEEFIESWARELPLPEPLVLVVHLAKHPPEAPSRLEIEQAVQNYYAYRARLSRLEFQWLMQRGWRSLLIGLVFLSACLLVATEFVPARPSSTLCNVLRESLTIGGWVAMWRPLEIYLYDWWPLRHTGKIYEKLSRMPVELNYLLSGGPDGMP
jgi:hypothetical protein